jgi:lysophospholipase L1-like esterase
VLVVNHGIGGTTTGGLGGTGDAARTAKSAPNARASVGGTTRYQAEVLGVQAPDWSGGETNTTWFPNGPVTRVNAYVPKTNDFAYVSMGTNDDSGPTRTLSSSATAANLRWMIQGWINAGHPADHFILTTLAPRTDGSLNSATAIHDRNARIRDLASTFGVHLIDLAAHVSSDDGLTWKSSSFQVGDGVHYSEDVRAWLGGRIASWMSAQEPPVP